MNNMIELYTYSYFPPFLLSDAFLSPWLLAFGDGTVDLKLIKKTQNEIHVYIYLSKDRRNYNVLDKMTHKDRDGHTLSHLWPFKWSCIPCT